MFYNTLVLTVLALLVSIAHGLSVRDTTSDIASTKGGILVKNGKQTSCELGVINSKAAFVAAYCIDFSGKTVNQDTEYEVYLDAGIDNTPAKYSVESIAVHPDFNATNGLNPIAVLQFNKDSTETWSNPIAIDRNNSWGDVLFIRRGMTSLNKMQWKTPLTATNKYTDATGCTRIPIIYQLNKNDILCSNATTYLPYAYLTECVVPYGSVDVYISGTLYIAGIHAQKVVTSLSSKCRPIYNQNSVFILFADYIAFANKVLGSAISYYPNSNGISPQSDAGYSMKTIPKSGYTLALDGVGSSAEISSTKGGVLVKNGKQTSCELGVIDSRAAFVAAPCLDYSSGNSVDQSTKYEVYLDAGIDNIAAKYTVTSITVHPGYNAETNANPVAILQFNKDSTASWSNPIAIDRKNSWGDSLFIRRGLLDIDAMEWNTPATITNYLDDTALCSYYSRLFKTNTDSFLCSNATTSPPYTYLTGCSIPYGSVDVYISGKLHVAGVYAYTAVSSVGTECTLRILQDSIYVLFADYIAFADNVLSRSIGYYPSSNGISPQSDVGYSMGAPEEPEIKGWVIIKGDFYADQKKVVIEENTSSSSASQTISSGIESGSSEPQGDSLSSIAVSQESQAELDSLATNSGKVQDNDAMSASDGENDTTTSINASPDSTDDSVNNAGGKSSKKGAILGGVCGILGGILLACLSLFLYKRWRRAHKDIYKDKDAQMHMQTMLVVDANADYSMPSTTSLVISEPTQPPAPSLHSNVSRDPFYDMDYDLPPLYERNAQTTTSITIDHPY
ncbi:hypothetical protein H4217_006071 [Coemansia sp. RSA 1939]|nr:hypothetical protein H4217_006071 [Coemansia sp. RSA 1939]